MAGETQGIRNTHTVWADALNKREAAPKETEQEKLQKTNVWDYAHSMQAGAYMG